MDFPGRASGKEHTYQCRTCKKLGFDPWVGKIPWRREWLLLLLLLSHFSRVWLYATPRRQPTRLPCPWDSPGRNTGVGYHFLLQCRRVKSESEVAQLCPTLSDRMDCGPPGSSVHWIFQARVLEWGTIPFSEIMAATPVFLPGESHGQRSLEGYSP